MRLPNLGETRGHGVDGTVFSSCCAFAELRVLRKKLLK